MENIKYTKEDVEKISSIVFKEIRSQFNQKKEDAMKQSGKDELYYKVKVKIAKTFYHEGEDCIQDFFLNEECVKEVMKYVDEKLTESGYQFFNSRSNVYEDNGHVSFEITICSCELENEDLMQLTKECKRNDKIFGCTVPIMFVLLLFAGSLYSFSNTIIQFIGKDNLWLVFSIPCCLIPLVVAISRITPVKWKLRKKYIKNS